MAEAADQSPESLIPTPEYLQPPRLGIIHLLALMTVTAVLLSFNKSVMLPQKQQIPMIAWSASILIMILSAADIVGASILLNVRYHRIPGHFQPGHWILIYSGIAILGVIAWQSIVVLCVTHFGLSVMNYTAFKLLYIASVVVQVILFFWFASRIPEPGRWKLFFKFRAWLVIYLLIVYLLIIGNVLFIRGSYYSSMWPRLFFEELPTVILAWVAILDLIRGARRDWLHWLGVCNALLLNMCSFIPQIVYYLMQ
jgi:hypothetical protein